MAARIAAAVATSSRAQPETNYDTFTPVLPRLSRKRKVPSVSSVESHASTHPIFDQGSVAASDSSSDTDLTVPDEAPLGCFAALRAWFRSRF